MLKQNSHALVTLKIGNFSMAEFTHPLFRDYCSRHSLEFIVIDQKKIRFQPRILPDQRSSSYEKYQIYDILTQFDRVLYLDGDILLNVNCPNLFELVPENEIGCVFEDVGSEAYKRFDEMDKAQRLWGKLPDYRGGYFNAGMFLVSQTHRELLRFGPEKKFGGRWPDQTSLNFYCEKIGFTKKNLGPSFNLLPVFSQLWKDTSSRRKASIIHYAGKESKGLFKEDYSAIMNSLGQ